MVRGYKALGLVPDDALPSMAELAARMCWKFQSSGDSTRVSLEDGIITIHRDGVWSISVYFRSDSDVQVESADIAAHYAKNRPDKDTLAKSSIHLGVYSDDDPMMDYFNDYIFVCEVLLEIPSIFLFDPITGAIISED